MNLLKLKLSLLAVCVAFSLLSLNLIYAGLAFAEEEFEVELMEDIQEEREDEDGDNTDETENIDIEEYDLESVEDGEEEGLTSVEGSKRLEELRLNIDATQRELDRKLDDTSLLEQKLDEATEMIMTLEGQLENMNARLETTQQRIVLTATKIDDNELQIKALFDEIGLVSRKIEDQKMNLEELLVLIYFQSEKVGFFDSAESQTIKLLLADEQVSDMLDQVDNLSTLEYSLGTLLNDLRDNKVKLERDKEKIEELNRQLIELNESLDEEKKFLVVQKVAKEKLLEVTKGEEQLYKDLLEHAKLEQFEVQQDLMDLLVIYSDYQEILNKDGFAIDDLSKRGVLSWPVSPSLGISAYFRDRSYKQALGVEHNAIDIRAPQGTMVLAPADGVVLKMKGGDGLDYHYIVLGHNDSVMTLFGHMFEIAVRPGQTVRRGQLIGLSGGMPGTRGAGWLTTGPHLHFEVFRNGKNVDPLPYLNQSELPEKYRN